MSDRSLTIFFSAGEPSGDLHGANLIEALRKERPNVRAIGYGGPKMEAAGCQLHANLTALAVMWVLHALLNIHKFWDLLWKADRCFAQQRPDAVVLIDFPGFNWWIARRAKKHGIPVFYYAPPQVWAWARWRVTKMRTLIDHVLCALPFERNWLSERGCRATFVGHPFFDEVHPLDPQNPFLVEQRKDTRPLVAILPGSRTQEVKKNLHWFIKAAKEVHAAVPQARFAIAAFKTQHAEMAAAELREAGATFPVEIHVNRTPELISLATCAMAVSGSVSLELLYHRTPTVILYYIGRFGYFLQQYFRKVKYITLVNLLAVKDPFDPDITPYSPSQPNAAEVLFPEYLTCRDRSHDVAQHVIEWLQDAEKNNACRAALAELHAKVGKTGAASKAVRLILADLAQPTTGPKATTASRANDHSASQGPQQPHYAHKGNESAASEPKASTDRRG